MLLYKAWGKPFGLLSVQTAEIDQTEEAGKGVSACFLPWDAWGTPSLVSLQFAEDLLGVSNDVYNRHSNLNEWTAEYLTKMSFLQSASKSLEFDKH